MWITKFSIKKQMLVIVHHNIQMSLRREKKNDENKGEREREIIRIWIHFRKSLWTLKWRSTETHSGHKGQNSPRKMKWEHTPSISMPITICSALEYVSMSLSLFFLRIKGGPALENRKDYSSWRKRRAPVNIIWCQKCHLTSTIIIYKTQ